MTATRADYLPTIGLGVTQIIGYGTLMYAYAVLLPIMAEDFGLSLSSVFGILSLGLLFGGLVSPLAGMLVDRFGGRYVMSLGSLVAGLAIFSLCTVEGPYGLFAAIVLAEMAGMCVLYNVAFASVARLESPVPATRAISIITLFGGVASTIFWPLTLWLEGRAGWEVTWMLYGAFLILICAPVHYAVLGGPQRDTEMSADRLRPEWPQLEGVARRRGMLWMVISFVFSGYLMGALVTLWVTNVQDLGHTAAMAALAGAVIRPFKTVGRASRLDLLCPDECECVRPLCVRLRHPKLRRLVELCRNGHDPLPCPFDLLLQPRPTENVPCLQRLAPA